MLNPTLNLGEQCLMVTEAMNALAPDYLDKFKKKKMILHRAIQTLSYKSGKPNAANKGACIMY
jgi:hypothetical protein